MAGSLSSRSLGHFAHHETFRHRIAVVGFLWIAWDAASGFVTDPALDVDLAVSAFATRRHAHAESGIWRDARVEPCAQGQTQSYSCSSVVDAGRRIACSI